MTYPENTGQVPAGPAHGNLGKTPSNKIDEALVAEILQLARGDNHDYNDCHFTEELDERHGIRVSVPTIRRIRRRHGMQLRVNGEIHAITAEVSAIHKPGCCCRLTAAN